MITRNFYTGAFALVGTTIFIASANANVLTFSFDATYNAAESAANTSGDTSRLTDYTPGLVNGQTYHGTFSYDTSAPPSLFPAPGEVIAQYPGATVTFSIPAHTFSISSGIAEVKDAITVDVDSFFAFQPGTLVSTVSGHSLFLGFGVEFISSSMSLYSSTNLPTQINLADFSSAVMAIVQDDYLGSGRVGHSVLDFDITNLSEVSSTPLPATFPLFATGLGALGLLGWRRKQKNAG